MELYVGGYAQGKLNYVIKGLQGKNLDCTVIDCGKKDLGIELEQGSIFLVNHLHLWVKELLSQGVNPQEKILEFCARYPDCILISDEVGNGIVPLEKSERIYREETGRILILLAQKAERVERIICGLGQRLK